MQTEGSYDDVIYNQVQGMQELVPSSFVESAGERMSWRSSSKVLSDVPSVCG